MQGQNFERGQPGSPTNDEWKYQSAVGFASCHGKEEESQQTLTIADAVWQCIPKQGRKPRRSTVDELQQPQN